MVKVPLVTVQVVETIVDVDQLGALHSWIVTTSTGYRCEVSECGCRLVRVLGSNRDTGETFTTSLENCTCKSEACRNKPASKSGVCHGWHRARVDKLAEDLVKVGKRANKSAPHPRPPAYYLVPIASWPICT